jgi:hypothetical protein
MFRKLTLLADLYILAFPKDKLCSKLVVGFIVIAEILQTLGDTRDAIRVFGSGWGNPQVLELVGWAWFSVPILGSTSEQFNPFDHGRLELKNKSIVACVGQLFFAWRISIFGNCWYIPGVIAAVFCSLVE